MPANSFAAMRPYGITIAMIRFDKKDTDMQDPRIGKLAQLLVQHSMRVAKDEKVLIESFDIPTEMTVALIRAVADAGGHPLVSTYSQPVLRALYQVATAEQMQTISAVERARMEAVQC